MVNERQNQQWNDPNWLETWKELEPSVANLLEPLLDALAARPGEAVLDVGCGGGLTTLSIAGQVAPNGSAVGVDISAPLIALAAQRAEQAGIANAHFLHGDAQVDDASGGPFDAATSRLGVMFFADPAAAFTTIRRQLKPNARLVFLCFQDAAENRWFPAPVLAKYGSLPGPSEYLPISPFALGQRPLTTKILEKAGFVDLQFEPLVTEWDGEIDMAAGAGFLRQLPLSAEQMQRAHDEMHAYVHDLATQGRDRVPRKYWIIRARNPG